MPIVHMLNVPDVLRDKGTYRLTWGTNTVYLSAHNIQTLERYADSYVRIYRQASLAHHHGYSYLPDEILYLHGPQALWGEC